MFRQYNVSVLSARLFYVGLFSSVGLPKPGQSPHSTEEGTGARSRGRHGAQRPAGVRGGGLSGGPGPSAARPFVGQRLRARDSIVSVLTETN